MNSKVLMIQGTSSGSGKSTIVIALCRIFSDLGYKVAPFKSQNMSSISYYIKESQSIISRIQALQSIACRKEPDKRINPVLLIPKGNYTSDVILDGKYFSRMHALEYYQNFVLDIGFPTILNSFNSLCRENDIILIEGAGSPAEINLFKYDVANMVLAKKIKAPVIITADIERGGCFASMFGTIALLNKTERNLVSGFVINKFLGEKAILNNAIKEIERRTKKEIIGIIPKFNLELPNEDSLDGKKILESETIDLGSKDIETEINKLACIIKQNINIEKILREIIGIKK